MRRITFFWLYLFVQTTHIELQIQHLFALIGIELFTLSKHRRHQSETKSLLQNALRTFKVKATTLWALIRKADHSRATDRWYIYLLFRRYNYQLLSNYYNETTLTLYN